MRFALLLSVLLLLSACGFHMRGHGEQESAYAFRTVYLKARSGTPFTTELRVNIKMNKLALADSAAQAEPVLDIVSQAMDKKIIGLSGAGQIREYQLNYRVSLRAYDIQQRDWLQADEIILQRTLTYDDAQILAKEQEELLLYSDMRADAVQQVIRRLSRAKPRAEAGAATQ